MKQEFKSLPDSEAEIAVILAFSEFEPFLKKAAVSISEEIEIEGFRRGKAPYDIVVKKVGEMRIYEKAANLAVEKFYLEVMKRLMEEKKDFTPIGRPEITITKLALGNDLEYKIKIVILPVFELPDYKSIAKKVMSGRKEISVSEEEVEKSLNWIIDSRSTFLRVERPIRQGDLVEIDFSARGGSASGGEVGKDNVLIDGGHSKNHPLVVGEGRFIPGFEDKLIGMRKDEEKSFDLKMPDDYHEKSLAGQTLNFKVKVSLVQEKRIPELTDEFAKSFGQFSSLDALKKSVRERMVFEKEKKESERLRIAIMDEIASQTKIELPKILIDAELDKMISELKQGIENMKMKWEEYLAQIKKSEDDLRKEWNEQAKRRVKIALCLAKIAKLEKIEPSEEEIKKEVDRALARYGFTEEAKKNIDEEALRDYAVSMTRNEKVFEFLETIS